MNSLFNKRFDLVLPIGAGCPTAISLGHCKMRLASSPFDWIKFEKRESMIELFERRFSDFMQLEDLVEVDANSTNRIVHNQRWTYCSVHDFSLEKSLDAETQDVAEKYNRRIMRLLNRLDSGCEVLLLWMDYPKEENAIPEEELREMLGRIQRAYSLSSFSLLYLHNDNNKSYVDRTEKFVTDKIIRCSFRYDAMNLERAYAVEEDLVVLVLNRVALTNKFFNPKSYRRYLRFKRNVGLNEQEWLERIHFAKEILAKKVMKKRLIWRITYWISRLIK